MRLATTRWSVLAALVLGGGAIVVACGQIEAAPIDDPLDAGADGAAVEAADEATDDARPAETGADAADAGDAGDAGEDALADAESDAGIDGGPLMRFAVVGDFGTASSRELAVANMIASWKPEFVVTTGDNDYATPTHAYDPNVGQFYHSFIAPYAGAYGAGAVENAFFPSIGNHDWDNDNGAAYAAFFSSLPNSGRYYEIDKGNVHFVFLDSDPREPDGTDPLSVQGTWAQTALAASNAPFQFVVFHHPAYTSGGRSAWMDWPFKTWGADVVLTGHVHNYERLRGPDGLTYFVDGEGGNSTGSFGTTHPSSEFRYNAKDGALLVEVSATAARFRYINVDGTLVDERKLDTSGAPVP